MDRPTYNALRERLHNDAMDEHLAKSKDYATEDVLSNFKIIADLLQVDPLLVWAVYDTKHNLAILRYCRDRKLDSEAIRGRLIDRLNYTDLLEGLINDPVTTYAVPAPFDPESGEDEEDEEAEMLNIAYADGWRGGYDKGVEDGYDHGHRQGLEDGATTEPRSERDQGLVDAGYRQGRAEGYAEGYMNGKDERNAT